MRPRTLCVLFTLLILIFLQDQCETVLFKMTKVYCESYNKSWVVIPNCRLKAKSRNKTTFNLNLNILHPANDIFIKAVIQKRENGYKPWLLDHTVNGCQFIRRQNHPIIKIIYGLFKEYTNINHTCPYVGEQILKDFYLKTEPLGGLPLPTGDYVLLLTWIFSKVPTFVTNVYFQFVEDLL